MNRTEEIASHLADIMFHDHLVREDDEMREILSILAVEVMQRIDEEARNAQHQRDWETGYYNRRDYGSLI